MSGCIRAERDSPPPNFRLLWACPGLSYFVFNQSPAQSQAKVNPESNLWNLIHQSFFFKVSSDRQAPEGAVLRADTL